MTQPKGIDLNQYKTQAKELLKQVRAAQPEALQRLRQQHPEHSPDHQSPAALVAPNSIGLDSIGLADAQLVIARENAFPSWTKFKDYLLFRNAVQALDVGDLPTLEVLLDKHPALVHYHCRVGQWYEQGYFAGATLLNHIAGNPGRCPLPSNILDIARLLLNRGARDTPPRPKYTIGLLLTSKQASEAGVTLPLIDLLLEADSIELDWTDPTILDGLLGNEAPAAAEALIRRGARMDIRHAALGRLDLVRRFIQDEAGVKADASLIAMPGQPGEAKTQRDEAFILACELGQTRVAFLLEQEVDPSSQVTSGQTGLHYAAHMGHLETVRMLLDRKAPLEVKNMYGATVLGQAVWSALNEPRVAHLPIIESLLGAGANVDAAGYPTGNAGLDALLRHSGAKP